MKRVWCAVQAPELQAVLPTGDPARAIRVDGNQLCDWGHLTKTILFYIGLANTAQSQSGPDVWYLTESVNAYCQAISDNAAIDFMALIASPSRPTLFVRKPRGPFRTNGCRAPIPALLCTRVSIHRELLVLRQGAVVPRNRPRQRHPEGLAVGEDVGQRPAQMCQAEGLPHDERVNRDGVHD